MLYSTASNLVEMSGTNSEQDFMGGGLNILCHVCGMIHVHLTISVTGADTAFSPNCMTKLFCKDVSHKHLL